MGDREFAVFVSDQVTQTNSVYPFFHGLAKLVLAIVTAIAEEEMASFA